MTIEELRLAKDRRPFEPFIIRLTDGRELEVRHPDAVAWGSDRSRTLSYVTPNDQWWRIEVALIVAIYETPKPAEVGGNGS